MPEPRILLMAETYHPVLGGGEKHTRSLATGLVRLGFSVQVITRRSSDDLLPAEVDEGVAIHRVGPPGKGRGKKFAMVPGAFGLARKLARESEVLMNGGTRVLALPARMAVAGTRCALVLRPELNGELDGSLALWGRRPSGLERSLARAAAGLRNGLLRGTDAVVAISEAIVREAVEAGFPAGKVHRIPHGIDMSEYAPASTDEKASRRSALGLSADRVLITYTGRLIEGKGLETLFGAMRRLEALDTWHLVLVGSGSGQVISIEEKLRKEADAGALRGRVTFTGRVENVAAYLQASDIFAFPTLDEALGMSAVEAQACGLPAVASRTGGVPDIVEDGVTGILVPPGEASALADALRSLLSDPERRSKFAKAARARAMERFAFDTMVTRYAQLFRSLARRGPT
ncbi:MAG TPA: glycosyltransferase family 4 protein [Vicinamibacteria bacterium]|nr:glycosyltransferase family 4 protein [Vicinamibacteria bacterium]